MLFRSPYLPSFHHIYPHQVLNVLGKDGADICDERKVNKEVEIWPLAAASFLEQIFMGEDKE